MRSICYRTTTGRRIRIFIVAALLVAGTGIVALLAITTREKRN